MRRRWLGTGLAAVGVGIAGAAGIYRNQSAPDADELRATAQPTLQPTFTPATTPASAVETEPSRDFVQLVAAGEHLFNPVLTTSDTGAAVLDKLYPRLLGQDVQTGEIVPTELAERWELAEDGRVYTFFLRDTLYWSDGQPVTAADFRFTYAALADPAVQSPYRDRTQAIAQIETPDPYTVVVTLVQPDCAVLQSLRRPLLPSHRYAPDFSDLASNPLNAAPEVSAGPFLFAGHEPGEQIVLTANPAYWRGAPPMQRWVLRTVPDATERHRQMAEGLADLAHFSAEEMASMDPAPSDGGLTWQNVAAPAFHFLALNLADPGNPQPGRDGNGALLVQEPHPLLGERTVRQAIALGIDRARVIEQGMAGRGYALTGDVLPAIPWAHAADLALSPYDPDQARNLLESTGWRDSDGDGVRERDGERLALRLTVNADNPMRMRAAELIAADLAAVGVAVELSPATFEAAAAELIGQRTDLALLGWDNLPADPGLSAFWSSGDDAPGSGANFTSFQGAAVDAWLEEARTLPGCDLAARGELYRQVQRRVAAELPYAFLSGELPAWAHSTRWTGIAPGPWGLNGDVHAWRLAD